MKCALFLTTEAGPALRLLAQLRREFPGEALVVFVRDDHRDELAAALAGCDVRRDKAVGGKVAFVRALRKERFDRIVVAWHDGERFQPLRLVALLGGARQVVAIDERGREWVVRWHAPWTWIGHALRRLSHLRAVTVLRVVAGCYRATVGVAFAVVALVPTALGLWVGGVPGRKS